MNKVEVILSPLLQSNFDIRGKVVVVIDILRATSTMCTILNNGAECIIPVVSKEEALNYKSTNPNYIIAGEREGRTAEGFDFGNSPSEYGPEVVRNKTVVLTTTNGTKCLNACGGAKEVLVGSFYNLSILADYLSQSQNDIVLFCSGWKDRVNLEDTIFAGALVTRLTETHQAEDDTAHLAADLYKAHEGDLISYLKKASHPQRFAKMGNTSDLPLCLKTDAYPVLIVKVGNKLLSTKKGA